MADDVVIRLSATGGGRVRSEVVSVGGEFVKLGQSAEKGAAQANTALGRLDQRLRNLGRGTDAGAGLKQLGAQASLFVSVPLGLALREATQEATRLDTAVSSANQTFGDASAGVVRWGDTTLRQIGLAKSTAIDAATAFGAMFSGAGIVGGDAAQLSQRWVELARDMHTARQSAGTLDDALGGLRGALRGEYDQLQRFLPAVSAAAIQQYALANGIAQTKGPLTDQQRLLATVGLLTEQMAEFSGTFASRQGEAAVEQTRAAEAAREAAAELGERLLPAQTKVNQATATMAGAFAALPDPAQTFAAYGIAAATAVGPIAGMAGAGLQLVAVLRATRAAQAATTAATLAQATATNSAASVSTLYASQTRGVGASLAALAGPLAIATAGFAALGVAMSQRGKDIREFVSEAAEASTEELVAAFDKLNDFDPGIARDAFRDIADQSEGTARRIIAGMRAAGEDTSRFERILRDVAAGHRRAARDAQDQTGAAFDLDSILKDLNTTAGTTADAMADWAKNLPLNQMLDAAAASRSYESELARLDEMVKENADAERERAQAVEDASRQVEDAARAQADAQERLVEAEGRLAEAVRGTTAEERKRLDVTLQSARASKTRADIEKSEAEERLARLSAGASPRARREAEAAVEQANAQSAEAAQSVAEAEQAVADARPGSVAHARQVRDAEREVADARRDVEDTARRARDAQDDLRDAQAKAAPSAEELAKREREVAEQLERVIRAAEADISLNFDQPMTATKNLYDRLKVLADLFPQLQPLIDTFLSRAPAPLSPSQAGRVSREADSGGVFAGPTLVQIGRRVGREAWIPQQGISEQRAAGLLGTAASWHGYRMVKMDDGGILGGGGRQFAQAQVVVVEKTTVEEYSGPVIANGLTVEEVRREQRVDARRRSLSRGSRNRG